MTGEPRVVIVGGGLGAVRTAQTVRDLGHRGEVWIVSAESEIPYDRPPLSEKHLAGSLPGSALALLPEDSYAATPPSTSTWSSIGSSSASSRTAAPSSAPTAPGSPTTD